MKNLFSEARLILPSADYQTEGTDAHGAHVEFLRTVEERLCAAFGGFTEVYGRGAWRDPAGRVVYDYVTIYDVAVPAFAPAHDASGVVSHEAERAWLGAVTTLRTLAREACVALRQSCIYLRCPTGEVLLIGPDGRSVNPDAAGPQYQHAAHYWASRANGRV